MLSPQEEMRATAHKSILEIQTFWIEKIGNNTQLYKAIKSYAHNNAKKENLTKEEEYFLLETIEDFKRSGLDLTKEKLKEVKNLKKEIAELTLKFETNIAIDQSHITVSKNELLGLEEEFIKSLKKTDNENISVGVDYPTYFNIMDNCKIESTRKKLYLAFNNRAYPKNELVLKKIIEKRDQLAKILGFKSYAHLDLSDQMAKTPDQAATFLQELYEKAKIKEEKEFQKLSSKPPKSVQLTDDNKIKAWDIRYIKNSYKKKNFGLDENDIAQYFTMEHTVKQVLELYEAFFSLKFKQTEISGLWHDEIKLIEVYQKEKKEILGYLLIDLYPRPNKYSHACQLTLIPSVNGNGPALALVVANFPKSTETKPSLLQRNDVETFFHELGHALHAILGRTDIASFSGTNVKTDFVEMPSQMLEEWMYDKDIIKKISSHYKTSLPIPDTLIDKILALKHFDSGDFLQRQCYLSALALEYFKDGPQKDPKAIYQKLTKLMRSNIQYDKNDNMYASFGHLSGYGAKYYSYMWSKVFAVDLFNHVKKHGLLNPKIGTKYVNLIIGKGGSLDPNNLLKEFLSREPNQKAFIRSLGLI